MAEAKKHPVVMNANRKAKVGTIDDVKAEQEGKAFGLVVESQGLTVSQVTGLRGKIRPTEASFRVVKNTLARIALKGTPFENLIEHMKGPTALVFSQDPINISKVLVEFAKSNDKLKIMGANLNGQALARKDVEQLAKLPPLNELRAKILGMIVTPATRIAGILQAPGGQIARVIAAKAKKEA